MKNLLLDIGNSGIKCALSANGRLSAVTSVLYDKNDFQKSLPALLKKPVFKNVSSAWVSSLDSGRNITVEITVKKITGARKVYFVNTRTKLPLKIDYEKSLGSDRICSAAAAFIKYGKHKNILIFDFGTATTVNFIRNGVYKGGLITAGLMTAASSLDMKTTLPESRLSIKASPENKTTKGAIASGLILQQVYFAEKLIESYGRKYGKVYTAATGGNLRFLKKYLKKINAFDNKLVLEGLNEIMIYNEHIR